MTQIRCVIWCAVSSRAQNEPDKISLPQQEADSRKLAEENNWRVIDVMRVPGHSRRYIDFHKLAADASQEGIDAFHRLARHWEIRDFDVLIVLDGNRFARTQALHAYVTEQTISLGARIYSLMDGWIDKQNHRMWIAMNGYKAAGEIDRLVAARDQAMTSRAERGLPVSSIVVFSHHLVRDPKTGRAIRLEVDESKRRLWDDLAEIVLEGVAWDKIEGQLFERYGHVNDKGEKYYPYCMYRLLMKPTFWGHTSRFHASASSKNGHKFGRWIYDESEPLPEGVIIFRNTHPAVWQGELSDRIRQEIDRRSEAVRGNATPSCTHRLSGLVICGECGRYMRTWTQGNYRGVCCSSAKDHSPRLPKCDNRGVTNEKKVITRLNELLGQMLHEKRTDIFDGAMPDTLCLPKRIDALETDIAELEEQARLLIRRQITASEDIQELYEEELGKLGIQLKNMKEARNRLQGDVLATQQSIAVQQTTLEEIANLTLEKFWLQESRTINQMLHRLMGKRRLVILNKEIVGIVEVHRKQPRR
jgi:hypothetical protein